MEFILPELKRQGVTDDQIEKIMVENPRRVLTFAPPAPLQGRETIR
jgi:predicted metal-dependent phosphotriesterase family hydrolase